MTNEITDQPAKADKWSKIAAIAAVIAAIATVGILLVTIAFPLFSGVLSWGNRLTQLEDGQKRMEINQARLEKKVDAGLAELKAGQADMQKPDGQFMRSIKLAIIEAQQEPKPNK